MFCFSYVMFIAKCACDDINYVGGCNGEGAKSGKCQIGVWVEDEFPVLVVMTMWKWGCGSMVSKLRSDENGLEAPMFPVG